MRKKFLSLILTGLVSMSSIGIPVLASEKVMDSNTQIIYENGVSEDDVPEYIIESILEENPNVGNITIYEIGTVENENNINIEESDSLISPLSWGAVTYENLKTTKTVTNSKALAKNVFQFSVAKGQKVTLTKEYSAKLSGSYNGTIADSHSVGADVSISGGYKKSTTYEGPSESSQYNSREFRTKFFEEQGSYVQKGTKVTNYGQGSVSREPVTMDGTYKMPISFANYSVDTKQY